MEGELRDDVDVVSTSSTSANPISTMNLPGQALKERAWHKGPGDAKRPRDHVGADSNEKSTKKRRKAY
ncbi:hypothetical protein VKT23_014671 [Stygiomarasmius scandens]|uniref:Uncharacterized protein n=1 Tax=Marasmiellus scandens TaxID=2682957 RepID=A0ABR1J396_9AGAR